MFQRRTRKSQNEQLILLGTLASIGGLSGAFAGHFVSNYILISSQYSDVAGFSIVFSSIAFIGGAVTGSFFMPFAYHKNSIQPLRKQILISIIPSAILGAIGGSFIIFIFLAMLIP